MSSIERSEVVERIDAVKRDLKDEITSIKEDLRGEVRAVGIAVQDFRREHNGRLRRVEEKQANDEGKRAAFSWVVPVVCSVTGGSVVLLLNLLLSHAPK